MIVQIITWIFEFSIELTEQQGNISEFRLFPVACIECQLCNGLARELCFLDFCPNYCRPGSQNLIVGKTLWNSCTKLQIPNLQVNMLAPWLSLGHVGLFQFRWVINNALAQALEINIQYSAKLSIKDSTLSTYILNKKGPNILPWSMRCLIHFRLLSLLSTVNNCLL